MFSFKSVNDNDINAQPWYFLKFQIKVMFIGTLVASSWVPFVYHMYDKYLLKI